MGVGESCMFCEYYIKDKMKNVDNYGFESSERKRLIKECAARDHNNEHKLLKLLIRFDDQPTLDCCINPDRDRLARELERKYPRCRKRFDPIKYPEYI
jgi:hypothetical protein